MVARRIRRIGRRVHVHLTVAGWIFLCVAGMAGVAAVRTQAPLAFVLFGGTLGALCISAVIARWMVGAVELMRELPGRAWQCQTTFMSYSLRNRRGSSAMALRMEELDLTGSDFASGCCVHLGPRSVFRAGARFAVRRRGRLTLERTRLSTIFPFGLVRASKIFERSMDLVVWPARGRLKKQFLRYGATEISSSKPAQVQGGSDEFFGLREYRTDDNPRWIHWKRSASRENLVVREMTKPMPEVLWLVVDTRLRDGSEPQWREREKTIRFAATLIDYAFRRGYKVGLALAYQDREAVWRPAPGLGQRTKLLDALADVDINTTRSLQAVLRAAICNGPINEAQVVIVSREAPPLRPMDLAPFHAARSLTVVCESRLNDFFEDDPVVLKEAG